MKHPFTEQQQHITVPLRAAVLMYSDWLQGEAFMREMLPAQAHFNEQTHTIHATQLGGDITKATTGEWPVTPDAVSVWRIVSDGDEFKNFRPVNIPPLLDDLRAAAARLTHSILTEHAALGDKYVEIRSEVLKSHTPVSVAPSTRQGAK